MMSDLPCVGTEHTWDRFSQSVPEMKVPDHTRLLISDEQIHNHFGKSITLFSAIHHPSLCSKQPFGRFRVKIRPISIVFYHLYVFCCVYLLYVCVVCMYCICRLYVCGGGCYAGTYGSQHVYGCQHVFPNCLSTLFLSLDKEATGLARPACQRAF